MWYFFVFHVIHLLNNYQWNTVFSVCLLQLCYLLVWYIRTSLTSLDSSIGGVMVRVLASSVVDRGFQPRSGQTKDYEIGVCCFSDKQAALRRKSKDWLARNQANVSEWSDMSTLGLLFQWASSIKIQLSVLVYSTKRISSSSSHWKLTCSRHDIAEKLLSWR